MQVAEIKMKRKQTLPWMVEEQIEKGAEYFRIRIF